EIVHSAAETHTDHEPQQPRQESELGSQYGADQRSRAGNRGEVMSKQNPLVSRVIVMTIEHRLRRHRPRVVQGQHLCSDKSGVIAIRDRNHAKCTDDDWKRVHLKTLTTDYTDSPDCFDVPKAMPRAAPIRPPMMMIRPYRV